MSDAALASNARADDNGVAAKGLVATPGQTIGPFFHYGMEYDGSQNLVPPGRADAIRLTGVVYDGAGVPIPDALVEIWQPAPDGTVSREPGSLFRDGWTFTGWGRCATDRAGRYTFSTVLPGPVAGSAARWFSLVVFARGLLNRLFTRCYLPGEGLDTDPLLQSVDEARRATLIAEPDSRGFVFDIHLQGDDETVFLRYGGQPD